MSGSRKAAGHARGAPVRSLLLAGGATYPSVVALASLAVRDPVEEFLSQ
jgi:hypothetical protein